MWTYLQTLPKPTSFAPTQYPLSANASEGEKLVAQKRCVACHGDFSGTLKFRFVSKGRTTVDAAAVIKQLRTPAQNMPIFSASQVTDEQAAQIAAYLQTRLDAVSAAGTTAAAPSTLPVSGGSPSASPLPWILVVVGVLMLGAGVLSKSKHTA